MTDPKNALSAPGRAERPEVQVPGRGKAASAPGAPVEATGQDPLERRCLVLPRRVWQTVAEAALAWNQTPRELWLEAGERIARRFLLWLEDRGQGWDRRRRPVELMDARRIKRGRPPDCRDDPGFYAPGGPKRGRPKGAS